MNELNGVCYTYPINPVCVIQNKNYTDDSKFTFLPITIDGEESEETSLENGMLICSSK